MCPFSTGVIHSRRTFPRGIGIPASSMNLTHSTDPQEEGQEVLITPQLIKNLLTLLQQPFPWRRLAGTREQGVPTVFFTHMSQSEGWIWGHVTSTWAFLKGMQEHHNGGDSQEKSDTIPPIEEWDLNPKVSNQVY